MSQLSFPTHFPLAHGLVVAAALVASGCIDSDSSSGASTPSYQITTQAQGEGALDPEQTSVQQGATASFSLTPDEGHQVARANGCGGVLQGQAFTTGEVDADCTVTAVFEPLTYEVSVSQSPHGQLSPASLTLEHGETDSLHVEADNGYEFAGVEGCEARRDGSRVEIGPVTADCTLSAEFEPALSISGAITRSDFAFFDATLNNPDLGGGANDTFGSAQSISNPAVVGGFVTSEPTGNPDHRYGAERDLHDYYRVDLSGEQRATLQQATQSSQGTGLRLDLLDANEDIVDSALGSGALQVTAPESGEYRIRITAQGPSIRYRLQVGEMDSLAQMGHAEPLRPHVDRVPGEYLVQMATPEGDSALMAQQVIPDAGAMAAQMGMQARAFDARRQAYVFRDAASAGLSTQQHTNDEQRMQQLSAMPGVASVTPNYRHRVHLASTPNDAQYGQQWHYPLIDLPQAWALEQGSEDVVVAVIDSGVALDHPDLRNKVTDDGWDFIEDKPVSAVDAGEHGTHVAGTVGAETDNNDGVAGAGWNVSIMPLRACDEDGCPGLAVLDAARYAAGLHPDRQPDRTADVVNLSLGGPGRTDYSASIYADLCEAGVLVVASAGNDNSSTLNYPASYPCVFSVAAVDRDGNRASYSTFNSRVDLSAPGGDFFGGSVLSTLPHQRYGGLNGTSMASPHVAGVFGLMKSIDSSLTEPRVRSWLQESALTTQTAGMGGQTRTNEYGHGLINAYDSVEQAASNAEVSLTLSTERLRFDPLTPARVLEIDSSGPLVGELNLSVDQPWIDVEPMSETDLPRRYLVTNDASGLAPGTYEGTITVTADNVQTRQVRVVQSVPSIDEQLGGRITPGEVALIRQDGDATNTVKRVRASEQANGTFSYEFSGVAPGQYAIEARGDVALDSAPCQLADACGVYPPAGEGETVRVSSEDRSDLNFPVALESRVHE